MQRLGMGLAVAMTAALIGAAPSQAGVDRADRVDRIDWDVTKYSGVLVATSEPSATDLHLHVKFKRVGGQGQRQVRMGERHKLPGRMKWDRYRYTDPVKLRVGEKVVFTTEAALVCAPARQPLGIVVQMRVKIPGRPWPSWQTYIGHDIMRFDCDDPSAGQPTGSLTGPSAPAAR